MKRILFIAALIFIICALAASLFTCSEYIGDTIKYYQTQERNHEEQQDRILRLDQLLLFSFQNLIFKGVYIHEENYTLEFDEILDLPDGNTKTVNIKQYYTYYKFKVAEVFKGDKSLENTEIYLINRNWNFDREEVIFQAGGEYYLFSEERGNAFDEMPEIKPLIKTNYWFSPSQCVFPIIDNYVYSTLRLIDYDKFISENCDNTFMNEWAEKQTKNDIVNDWRMEPVRTMGGEHERICIPIDTFADFLTSAIEYYT